MQIKFSDKEKETLQGIAGLIVIGLAIWGLVEAGRWVYGKVTDGSSSETYEIASDSGESYSPKQGIFGYDDGYGFSELHILNISTTSFEYRITVGTKPGCVGQDVGICNYFPSRVSGYLWGATCQSYSNCNRLNMAGDGSGKVLVEEVYANALVQNCHGAGCDFNGLHYPFN